MFFGDLTIAINGFSMVFGLATIAFNGFRWFWTIGQTMRWFRWIVVVYCHICDSSISFLLADNAAQKVVLGLDSLVLFGTFGFKTLIEDVLSIS